MTNASEHGIWALVGAREFFLPFEDFPWFLEAPVRQVLSVTAPDPTYLRWPDLDVDLAVESIEFPDRFPLIARTVVAGKPRKGRGGKTGARVRRVSRPRR